MSQALIPSIVVASNICEDMGDSNETKIFRVLKKIGLAYKEINLFLSPRVDVQSIIISAEDQSEMPCDFVYATKVSLGRGGRFVTLDLNKNLRQTNIKASDSQIESQCNALLDGSIDPALWLPFYNCFRNGNNVGEIYGMGSGWHSNNWYDIKYGVLNVGSMILNIADEICVEYKSDGRNEAYKLIPSELEKCITYGAKALLYEDSSPTKAADFQAKYEKQYHMIKRMYSHRSPDYMAWLLHSSDRGTLAYPV